MASFPDFLYGLTPRDEQVTPLEIVNTSISANAVSDNVETDAYVVPLGKILLLNSIGVTIVPGAGQLALAAYIYRDNNGTVLWGKTLNPTGRCETVDFAGSLMIGEGARIVGGAYFDLGLFQNDITMNLSGVLIPRGNFAV